MKDGHHRFLNKTLINYRFKWTLNRVTETKALKFSSASSNVFRVKFFYHQIIPRLRKKKLPVAKITDLA